MKFSRTRQPQGTPFVLIGLLSYYRQFIPGFSAVNLSANDTAGVFAGRFSQDREMFRPQLG